MDKQASLLDRLLAGQATALSRAITLVENEPPTGENNPGSDILKGIQPHLGKALVIGFTGPPGAGKSTLVNAFIGEMRQREKTVGVVAVDPSSPLSGGAILGDRIRMTSHADDPDVFVRSLASRGHLGGLSPMAARVIDVMDAAGKDIILIETVGAGQSEVEIAEIADTKVVVCAPGLGDDVQAIKAGILEIADILVVNKFDLPLAERTRNQLKAMLSLRRPSEDSEPWKVPVLGTTATGQPENNGLTELADAVLAHYDHQPAGKRRANPLLRIRRLLAEASAQLAHRRVMNHPEEDTAFAALLDDVQTGRLSLRDAAARLVKLDAEGN